MTAAFEKGVFINCPFDKDYAALLRPICFTILHFGLEPRLASDRLDSAQPRIEKIVDLIRRSKYGIHDLSRIEAKKRGELFRLNMPFELGLDVGCRTYGVGDLKTKRCLVLEEKEYRYQRAISDLSGCDIRTHKGEPIEVVRCIRDWLVSELKPRKPIGATGLWKKFNDFTAADYEEAQTTGHSDLDIERRPISEMTTAMSEWLKK